MVIDLFYSECDGFIQFYPSTEAGLKVWHEMASDQATLWTDWLAVSGLKQDGHENAKFFANQKKPVLQALKKAGYHVAKQKPDTETNADDLLAELFA